MRDEAANERDMTMTRWETVKNLALLAVVVPLLCAMAVVERVRHEARGADSFPPWPDPPPRVPKRPKSRATHRARHERRAGGPVVDCVWCREAAR